jgi:hypothetical protein
MARMGTLPYAFTRRTNCPFFTRCYSLFALLAPVSTASFLPGSFQLQEAPFHLHAISEPAQRTVCGDDPMARDHQANWVAPDRLPYRARPAGFSGIRRQLAIGTRLPKRYFS